MMDLSEKQMLFLGCGAVAKCVLGTLDKVARVNAANVKIVDLLDYRSHPDVAKWLRGGAEYVMVDIRKQYKALLDTLRPHDLVIDLSNRTNSVAIIAHCKARNLHYLNTSMEDEATIAAQRSKVDTYAMSYTAARAEVANIQTEPKHKRNTATMVLEMGMNPGLVSVFAKHALRVMSGGDMHTPCAALAERLNVQVIHISETDSTTFTGARRPDATVFCNTWCCDGLNDEYSHDSEFSYGTHERRLPGPKSQRMDDDVIDTGTPAFMNYTDSYVPGEAFIGCIIPHGEGISLGKFLKTPTYRPTVHYVYKWSPLTQHSLATVAREKIGGTFAPASHVVANYYDDMYGIDKVGVLMLCGNGTAYWCGSVLDNLATGHHSGTLQQVAAGVLLGIRHMVENPGQGIVYPESIDERTLDMVIPLLGDFVCRQVSEYSRVTRFRLATKKQFDDQFV